MTGLNPRWCAQCTDEFTPIEAADFAVDDVAFCSEQCREAFTEEEDALTAYHEARYGGATVWL